mgnify:CR=1 FL=1
MIYTVEVLLDDGEVITFDILAASPEHAQELAGQQAIEYMLRPASTEVIESEAA